MSWMSRCTNGPRAGARRARLWRHQGAASSLPETLGPRGLPPGDRQKRGAGLGGAEAGPHYQPCHN